MADPVTLSCPRCRKPLQERPLGPADLFMCAACEGLWVDMQTWGHIKTHAEDFAPLLSGPSAGDPPSEPVRYVPCPACQSLMNRTNFAQRSGVIIDYCKEHGTWFDADELRRVVEYIRVNGPEPARTRASESVEARRAAARGSAGLSMPSADSDSSWGLLGFELLVDAFGLLLDLL